MEFARKMMPIAVVFLLCSCRTILPAALAEVKPLPREVVVEKKVEYEPVYAVMKVLEVSEREYGETGEKQLSLASHRILSSLSENWKTLAPDAGL